MPMARKKTESDPAPGADTPEKKVRWYRQLWMAYTFTREVDPAVTWFILAAFVGSIALGAVIGVLTSNVVYFIILGVLVGVMAAMFVLGRRVEPAMYKKIDGTPGASLSAVRTISRGWDFGEEPVAVDPRTQDLVFRGVGQAGVVLLSEGPAHRVGRLLETERKRLTRILPNVPVHTLQVGHEDGQVPLAKLAKTVKRLKKTLTKAEVDQITKRLHALGGLRMPLPKGIDPTKARPDRKATRGR